MTPKIKAILAGLALIALLVTWFTFKSTIKAFVVTAGFGALLLVVLYVAFKIWLWRRKRRRRKCRRDK